MDVKQRIEESKGEKVLKLTLTCTRDEWNSMMMMLGLVMGTITRQGMNDLGWNFLAFVNKLNADNPEFHPYQIPPALNVPAVTANRKG